MVRAKFRCQSVEKFENGSSNVSLSPVTSGSDENKSFYKWTPGGEIKLQTINLAAAEQFEPGGEYYVDFTKSE